MSDTHEREPSEMRFHPTNPFYAGTFQGRESFHYCVEDRLRRVKEFNAEQCRLALSLAGLQKAVRLALECRLRKLEREKWT